MQVSEKYTICILTKISIIYANIANISILLKIEKYVPVIEKVCKNMQLSEKNIQNIYKHKQIYKYGKHAKVAKFSKLLKISGFGKHMQKCALIILATDI